MTVHPSLSRNLLALSLGLALAGTTQAQSTTPHFSVLDRDVPGQSRVYDGLIITYRDGSRERRDVKVAARKLQQISAASHARNTGVSAYRQNMATLQTVRRLAVGADLVRPGSTLSQPQLEALMADLRADPAIAHVEPNLLMKPLGTAATVSGDAAAAPNDPYYAMQWDLRKPDGHLEMVPPDTTSNANRGGIDLLPAWRYGTGEGVVVAVIDTGITAHPDLDTSLADAGYDFISNALSSGRANNERVAGGWDTGDWTRDDKYLLANGGCLEPGEMQDDSSWHGTHVAGTIAARTNNGTGVAGIAPGAKILPIRVLGHCGGSNADIADAIVWASGGHVDGVPDNQNPAEIINLSLGGIDKKCDKDSVTAKAIAAAIARGSLVIVAVGNDNLDASLVTPANCPGVLSVAANGISGGRAYYSNYGNTVALSAPGGGYRNDADQGVASGSAGLIYSTLNTGKTGPELPTYEGSAGTSMAAPHVAGVAALAISAAINAGRPMLAVQQLRDILVQTSNPFPTKPTLPIGAGIVDAGKAAARAAGALDAGTEATALAIGPGRIAGLSGAAGASQLYRVDVPAGARNLQIRTFGGRGQVKLYGRAYRAPDVEGSEADNRSLRNGTLQNLQMAAPTTSGYFFRLVGGNGGYADVSLSVSYSE